MKSVATFAVVLVLACATANAFVLDRDIAAAVARATGGNATDAAFTWEDCCSSSCKASNMQITIDPANPQKGQDYTYSSSYDLSEDVTGGKATYKITLRGIPIRCVCVCEAVHRKLHDPSPPPTALQSNTSNL